MTETAKTNVKWNKVMRGWYTNAPLMGELRSVKTAWGSDRLQFSDEYEDWKNNHIGNVECSIAQSYTGGKIGNAPVGTWTLVIDGHLDHEPFATLADAKAAAEAEMNYRAAEA